MRSYPNTSIDPSVLSRCFFSLVLACLMGWLAIPSAHAQILAEDHDDCMDVIGDPDYCRALFPLIAVEEEPNEAPFDQLATLPPDFGVPGDAIVLDLGTCRGALQVSSGEVEVPGLGITLVNHYWRTVVLENDCRYPSIPDVWRAGPIDDANRFPVGTRLDAICICSLAQVDPETPGFPY